MMRLLFFQDTMGSRDVLIGDILCVDYGSTMGPPDKFVGKPEKVTQALARTFVGPFRHCLARRLLPNIEHTNAHNSNHYA